MYTFFCHCSAEHSEDQRGVPLPQEVLQYSSTCSVCSLPPFGAMVSTIVLIITEVVRFTVLVSMHVVGVLRRSM